MASLGNNATVAQAFNRFGFGGRQDDKIPADPVSWLRSQIAGPDVYENNGLLNTASALALYYNYSTAAPGSLAFKTAADKLRTDFNAELAAITSNAIDTKTPFRERLVWFWANHFALQSNASPPLLSLSGPYIREAIRPHLLGTFTDLLTAAVSHPALLYSLNNERSTGPNSPAALSAIKNGRAPLGFNENMGREIQELFTTGALAGYTQADVDSMAYILTGWSVNVAPSSGGFVFNTANHQPGSQTVQGMTFPGSESGGFSALQFLGTHPLTYQRIASKLCRHFISDSPSASDVQTVVRALSTTGGNLTSAYEAIITLQSAWVPMQKLKTPIEFALSAMRTLNVAGSSVPNLQGTIAQMGEPIWAPSFPDGYPDVAAKWVNPSFQLLRADWSYALGGSLPASTDVSAALACSILPFASAATVSAVNNAPTVQEKTTTLLMSPEFQRR